MRKRMLPGILAVSLLLLMFSVIPLITAAGEAPTAVFSDGDLDNVYFIGDTLSFNLSGLPVGVPPSGMPAGTTLRVSLGIVDGSNTFSDFTLFNTLSNGMGDGTGWYAERTLMPDGTLSADISGQIVETPAPPMGAAAVKLYAFNGTAWQNVLQGQSPDYVVLAADGRLATVGLDNVLEMPDGVTSDPVIGAGAQNEENLLSMDISFSKVIADGISGSISFSGLNLLDNTARSQLSSLEDGLIMQKVAVPAEGNLEQYIMGVDLDALSFLADKGATVSVRSASFDGLSADDFDAEAADVSGGLVSGLAFDDLTDTVSFTVNHFSSYTLSVLDPEASYDGEFDLENGTGSGSGFSFDGSTLTINTNGNYRVYGTGAPTGRDIAVNSGVAANITLDNVNGRIFRLNGTASAVLVLKDGTTNTFSGSTYNAAVRAASGASLTIQGGADGTGCLVANGGNGGWSGYAAAGIGGNHGEAAGTIVINSGVVTAYGGSDTSGPGAGIGGGGNSGMTHSGGSITINGGTVRASGGTQSGWGYLHAPGIGGYDPTQLVINGGEVEAYGRDYGIYSSTLAIDGDASVQAFSSRAGEPALKGKTASGGHEAYLLNIALDAAVSSDTEISIAGKDGGGETFQLTLPGGYRNFATTVGTSGDYNLSANDGAKRIVKAADNSRDFSGKLDAPDTDLSYYSAKMVDYHPVVKIDDTEYESLSEAMAAVSDGQTIQLLEDLSHSGSVSASAKSFEIDLAGKTLAVSSNADNGVSATNGQTITISGGGSLNVTTNSALNYAGLYASGPDSAVNVDSSVTATVTVSGTAGYGVLADDGGTVRMTGSVTAGNNADSICVYAAGTGSLAEITGPVSGGWTAVYATEGAEADITGDVTCSWASGYGVSADDGAEVTVNGNISSDGVGVSVFSGSNVTVDGKINDYFNFIEIGSYGNYLAVSDYEAVTTRPGYLTYTDGDSTVWIKAEYWSDLIFSTSQYPFGGGDGSSEEQAYEISTPEQLAQLAYNVNAGNNYLNRFFV
ncbi:MAG: right-handed parallel beta-helix repeat-containing protein, partial [Syntrophomonadaceae bacterium]|nr:right-handed parallel beta-helix repeat-containing protein [Syntrophomonadaceae bacterium]